MPYARIYGVQQPRPLPPLANNGRLSRHLPEGTPFGLVGTASLYKRESYPGGVVPAGKVTAECPVAVENQLVSIGDEIDSSKPILTIE